jgi:transposase
MGAFLMEAAFETLCRATINLHELNTSRPPRPCRAQQRQGQPAVRGGGHLEVPHRRALPERFGDWKNTHKRFSRCAENGVWGSPFKTLADDPNTEYAMIDATIVRAHQHSAGLEKKADSNEAIGRSRGGLTTKDSRWAIHWR